MSRMAAEAKNWYYRAEDGSVYGPAGESALVEWAEDGRIQPTGYLSSDRVTWIPAQTMPELKMHWLVEAEPGKVYGPFNRKMLIALSKTGAVPPDAKLYRLHELDVASDPEPEVRIVEKVVEKVVEKIVEVPVEKIVERVIEVAPPARKTIVDDDPVDATGALPPPAGSGIFKDVDRTKLAALEAAARRELEAAKGGSLGNLGKFFSRRK